MIETSPIVGSLRIFPWQSLAGGDAAVLKWRRNHWDEFLKEGLPTRNLESWHYTDVHKWLAGLDTVAHASGAASPVPPLDDGENRIVLLNGQFQAEQSRLPDGVEVTTWGEIEKLRDLSSSFEILERELGGLAEFHQGVLGNGYLVRIADGQKLPGVLNVIYQWDDQAKKGLAAHTNWISLGVGASATVVEWYRGAENLVTSVWTVSDLAQGSQLQLVRAQTHRSSSVHMGLVLANLNRDAKFSGVLLDRGGSLSRETWALAHYGEGASSELQALQLGESNSHMDLRTVTHHNVPKGKSIQRSRALLAGACRTVFNGKIVIAKDAQEVAASQLSQNVLMHEEAEADAKPELEVYADNVKANHGASVGQISEEELFYLESRGLPADEAKRLLAEGFARDTVREISDEALKRKLESWIQVQVDTLLARKAPL